MSWYSRSGSDDESVVSDFTVLDANDVQYKSEGVFSEDFAGMGPGRGSTEVDLGIGEDMSAGLIQTKIRCGSSNGVMNAVDNHDPASSIFTSPTFCADGVSSEISHGSRLHFMSGESEVANSATIG